MTDHHDNSVQLIIQLGLKNLELQSLIKNAAIVQTNVTANPTRFLYHANRRVLMTLIVGRLCFPKIGTDSLGTFLPA